MSTTTMTDLQAYLLKLNENLQILQQREAKYAGRAPLDLLNRIRDHKTAIALTEQVRRGDLSETDWQQGILPLALSSDLLEMAARITPDLRLHEQAYRQRLKERYAADAPYYIPLGGETSEVVSAPPAEAKAPRSIRRRRRRAEAEYHEWIQAGQELKRVKLDTLREGVDKYPRLILLGDPGSGKTTALENLAYEFADEPDKLPLPLRMSEFGPGQSLEEFIGHSWAAPELAANLAGYLEAGRLFVLFDALNEMPRQGYKERALALRHFIDTWWSKGNRFLVTCRMLDYGEELSGLQRAEVQPLSEEQIQAFIQNELPWTWAGLWQRLTERSDNRRRLLDMARNPYLLTMMIDIYAEDEQLGRSQTELMTRFTQILMGWAKKKSPPDKWLDAEAQAEALAVMAFEMQDRAGSGAMVKTGKIKTVMPHQVQPDPAWPPVPAPPDQVLTLAAGANIIEMPVDRSTVRFYHQLLQEYFAARHMLKQEPAGLAGHWRWDWWLEKDMPLWERPEDNWDSLPPPPQTGWEETTIIAAGLAAENDDQLVQALIQINPVLAGRCVHEGRAKVATATRQALIEALLTTIGDAEVALRVRIVIGEVLGELGDPRRGELVTISAGKFIMGGSGLYDGQPQHELILPEYQIGKYPVTNAEYAHFIEAGGYRDKRWWTEAGWQWKGSKGQPHYWGNTRFHKPNQPVNGVSWYECVAYCRWLSTETRRQYRLPTEAEWEKAARSVDGRIYPWGHKFEPERLNAREGKQQVRTTTPVGVYPNGVSPFGVFDCAGNVWEWASSIYENYPYNPTDGRENVEAGDNLLRVLRGGSFDKNLDGVRCAYRSPYFPSNFVDSNGFRVALVDVV